MLVLPEYFEINPDWQETMVKEVKKLPEWFNLFKSRERLNEAAERQDLMLDYLYPYFRTYQDRHDLK